MTGEAGMSIALRINATTDDELEALSRRALDELAPGTTRAARLIVNGVEQIPTHLQGTAHGH
ncbi:hypothetical protein BTH42_14950 [Burkholderia sp. SRS-W-2-2016]|nr:hypothetical protein BTH42_14950 [Burkholderia sp. SRS-W-2-2016]